MMVEAWFWLIASVVAILVITMAWLWPRRSLGEIEGSTT
jgi:hypothetical protein